MCIVLVLVVSNDVFFASAASSNGINQDNMGSVLKSPDHRRGFLEYAVLTRNVSQPNHLPFSFGSLIPTDVSFVLQHLLLRPGIQAKSFLVVQVANS